MPLERLVSLYEGGGGGIYRSDMEEDLGDAHAALGRGGQCGSIDLEEAEWRQGGHGLSLTLSTLARPLGGDTGYSGTTSSPLLSHLPQLSSS